MRAGTTLQCLQKPQIQVFRDGYFDRLVKLPECLVAAAGEPDGGRLGHALGTLLTFEQQADDPVLLLVERSGIVLTIKIGVQELRMREVVLPALAGKKLGVGQEVDVPPEFQPIIRFNELDRKSVV